MITCKHGIERVSFCVQCEEIRVAGKELSKANDLINRAFMKGLAEPLREEGGFMRKVIYSEYVRKHEYYDDSMGALSGKIKRSYNELEEQGEALFHQWGNDFEEFENGVGTYSTAIIELEDGTVKNVPVEHIQFIGGEIEK